MGGAVADVTNLFLPSDCRLCSAAHVASATRLGGARICEACLEKIVSAAGVPAETMCARCGEDFGMESARFAASMGLRECSMCRLAPPEFTRAVAYGTYDHEMRELLHQLKFDGQRRLAEEVLGGQLAAAVKRLEVTATELVVVPVPLFKARQRERGFNQAELLAWAMVKTLRRERPEWRLNVRPALERVKDTRPLYRLDPRQRRRNLKGAFRIAKHDAVRGREVLLIDDIMTTGATARECSAVLLRAGAAKVWVATVARAQTRQSASREFAMWDAEAEIVH
jgi:ComF family protein